MEIRETGLRDGLLLAADCFAADADVLSIVAWVD
jgi:hypothetical protein